MPFTIRIEKVCCTANSHCPYNRAIFVWYPRQFAYFCCEIEFYFGGRATTQGYWSNSQWLHYFIYSIPSTPNDRSTAKTLKARRHERFHFKFSPNFVCNTIPDLCRYMGWCALQIIVSLFMNNSMLKLTLQCNAIKTLYTVHWLKNHWPESPLWYTVIPQQDCSYSEVYFALPCIYANNIGFIATLEAGRNWKPGQEAGTWCYDGEHTLGLLWVNISSKLLCQMSACGWQPRTVVAAPGFKPVI